MIKKQQSNNDDVRLYDESDVINITDESKLYEIAKKSLNYDVRIAAIKKIDNNELLMDIANTEDNVNVLEFISKYTYDEDILKIVDSKITIPKCPKCGSYSYSEFRKWRSSEDVEVMGFRCNSCGKEFGMHMIAP